MKTLGHVSAAHVSKILSNAGFPRADEVRLGEISGFVVSMEPCEGWDGAPRGTQVVTVGYQDYDHLGDYSDRARSAAARICKEAFDGYATTLRRAGYTVEDWLRYDNVRLGLFVTGKEGRS
jgi:hypothetical protein